MVHNRSREWFARVKHPNGNWADIEVVGKPERNPKVNGLPTIRIPVRSDDKWNDNVWEEQEMEVYYKGERQPIEQFERLERSQDSTEIIGRGGIELRNIVDTEYKEEQTTTVATEIINNNSTYTPNVDEVTGGAEQNVQIDSATTTSDFQNRTSGILDTDPIEISNNKVQLLQSNFVFEGEDEFISGEAISDEYTDGLATYIGGGSANINQSGSYFFSTDYEIEDWAIQFRTQAVPESSGDSEVVTPGFEIVIDGTVVENFIDGASFFPDDSPSWESISNSSNNDVTISGSTKLEINVTSASVDFSERDVDGYGEYRIDVISVYDDRFSYNFDNQVDSDGGHLDGPELYPESYEIEFDTVSPARAVSGGRVEATFNSLAQNQQVALSNDGGTTYNVDNNSDTFETDFDSAGTTLRLRIRLGGYGSRSSTTPLTGHLGQEIQDFTLFADLQTLPFVINTTLNDRLVDVLNNIAETGNFVWEFNIDNDGNKTVEFTTTRQRERPTSLPITDYNVKKDLSKIVEKVILFGGTNSVARDTISANHGTEVSLREDYLKEGSESVNEANGDASYVRGDDYTINYRLGEITTLSGGNIDNGESLDVSYEFKIRATATKTGATDPITQVVEVPELTTQELANNIATRVLNELSVLEETVDLTIPATVPDFSVIDALQVEELPTDETFQIRSIEGTTEQIVVRAGNRESLESVTSRIRSQVKTVSRK